jgi:hypothetical protein
MTSTLVSGLSCPRRSQKLSARLAKTATAPLVKQQQSSLFSISMGFNLFTRPPMTAQTWGLARGKQLPSFQPNKLLTHEVAHHLLLTAQRKHFISHCIE